MKNHKLVNGRLLQTNKTWRHLKLKQRQWITLALKEHDVDTVYRMIEEAQIWIPYSEIKKRASAIKQI